MIYLIPEVISGYGEDTFWTWFKREFKHSSFDIPTTFNEDDCVLVYSTKGKPPENVKSVALLWELYPEMKKIFGGTQFDTKINLTNECAKYATYRTVSSELSKEYYSQFGEIETIPIGINTELFKPLPNKEQLRIKYKIPQNKRIGIWVGTDHPMKGFDVLKKYASNNPNIFWILIWYSKKTHTLPNSINLSFQQQENLVELMNCADFYYSASRLRPYYMVEIEAMSTNLPMILSNDIVKDFAPTENSRQLIMDNGWDRNNTKQKWITFFDKIGVKYEY